MVANLHKCIKTNKLYSYNGWAAWYISDTSVKLFLKIGLILIYLNLQIWIYISFISFNFLQAAIILFNMRISLDKSWPPAFIILELILKMQRLLLHALDSVSFKTFAALQLLYLGGFSHWVRRQESTIIMRPGYNFIPLCTIFLQNL